MRAYRVVAGMGVCLLTGCVTAQPQQSVILSERQSAFETPLDGHWRKANKAQPLAVLLGRAETTVVLLPRKAALEAGCYRGKPRIRVAYDVGLRSGPINVAYRFGDGAEQTGRVLVRGQRRNIVVIDYQPTALAFLSALRAAATLDVRVSRSPFEMHDAHFKWDPQDPVLSGVLTACQAPVADTKRSSQQPAADDTDEPLDDAIKDVLPET